MTQEITTRSENIGFRITSYVILVVAGLIGLNFDPPITSALRWTIIGLLFAIAVVQWWSPADGSPSWRIHLHVGLQGALAVVLMFLQPGWTMYPVLLISPIIQAILGLSLSEAKAWIAAFTLATVSSFVVGCSLREGLVALVYYGVLYAFFGAFAGTLRRADTARREGQVLLSELQAAHVQLQDYALRVEEMAVVEERNRLAREMHDTLGHRLTVVSVQLEAAQRLCPSDPERVGMLVSTVREQVREALSELRATVATLRSPVEVDLQLRSALRRLVDQFEQATGLTTHKIVPEELPPLPDAHRLALYRAAQEALTNIQKHAGAQQAWLALIISEHSVTLLVSDDGCGITRDREHTGFGLHGLRERAEQLGGSLYVEPRSGGGTQLSFSLPLSGEGTDA